jgi:type III pantothenate kinase
MKLLVDFGNTRLKWATQTRAGTLQPGGALAHAGEAPGARLEHAWRALQGIDGVRVASVVAPAQEQALADFVQARFGCALQFVRSPAQALGIRNAYAEPARLGIDRFLALAALHAAAPCARVLVSVGTALTADALGADGVHHGGIIVAAPALMRTALLQATARVGVADGTWQALPRSTADGVHMGALYAAAGAVDRFRAVAADDLGEMPRLDLTGGGAGELAPLLPDARRHDDLVLAGLALWSDADGVHR